jgi:hypothetical protein
MRMNVRKKGEEINARVRDEESNNTQHQMIIVAISS